MKYELSNCHNNYNKILKIFNESSNNFFLTKIKNSYIINSFCKKRCHIIYLKKKNNYIGFLIFNTFSDDLKKYIIINVEYLCIVKKFQSMGLSTKLLKYFLKNYEKIILKIKNNIYDSIYLSAILVNHRSFSNIFDLNNTFPVSKNIFNSNDEIIEKVKKLNNKFIYLNDYVCFNLFSIKIKILFDYLFNKSKNEDNINLKYYKNNIHFPIGLGFYISTITKLK
jgi:hypothetical protein